MEKNQISRILTVLQESPVRKICRLSDKKIFIEECQKLDDILYILDSITFEDSKPVKIVVMGEVKSGKSTFINALVGKEVSRMDVLEATALIHEMVYDEHESFDVHLLDGRITTAFSQDEVHKILEKETSEKDEEQKVSKVVVKLPLDILKKIHIVDTPGLQTITTQNSKITKNYMINADAILWVMNIHHNGQEDVIDAIESSKSFGKPLLGLINRLDELDEDWDEVMDHMEDEIGYLFKKIFPLSARTSWEGIMQNDLQKIKKGNVVSVAEYLREQIADHSTEFIAETTINIVETQVARDLEIHEWISSKIDRTFEKMQNERQKTVERNQRLKSKLKSYLENTIKDPQFGNQLKELRMENSKCAFETYTRLPEFRSIVESHITKSYDRAVKYVSDEWVRFADFMIESEEKINLEESIVNIQMQDSFELVPSKASNDNSLDNDGIFKMSLATLVSSAVLASIAAPPLYVFGVMAGGFVLTKNIFSGNKNIEDNARVEVLSIIEEIKYNQVEQLYENLSEYSDSFEEKIKEIISSYYFGYELKHHDFIKLQDDIKSYKYRLTSDFK